METIFLSYTYRSHPDHQTHLEGLHRYVVRMIEAMALRVVDGVDVGGRPLDDALRGRIRGADALIALMTPQADDAGNVTNPEFVSSEFHFAVGQGKPTIRVLHELLRARGIGAGDEYTLYRPGSELDVILKLMNTIALWRREYGRRARVRIEPDDLVTQYDERKGHRCEFQLISEGVYRDFERAELWQEPGAAYALLPKLREGDRVRLRVVLNDKTWQSRSVINPFIGAASLEKQP